jgi:hypothetical protein
VTEEGKQRERRGFVRTSFARIGEEEIIATAIVCTIQELWKRATLASETLILNVVIILASMSTSQRKSREKEGHKKKGKMRFSYHC